jgi:TPR repeat protein
VQLFEKACDAGDAAGCSNLGFMHSTGQGAAQDKAKAARLFQIACGRGFAMGCTNLALMYEKGDGVAQDLAQAVALYQRACTNGLAAGCDAVKLAAQLFRDGCDAGTALRCANLGDLYARGLGVEANKGEAVRLYQGACQKGIARACVALRSLQ